MKIIYCSNYGTTQVSDEDYEFLNQTSWQMDTHGRVMRNTSINGVSYLIYMHHVVADRQGIIYEDEIDHKDRNPSNNQRENLRPATRSQQLMNTSLRSDNTSGYKGVSFHKKINKWHARIKYEGTSISLGVFMTEEEAARAYDKAAKLYQKEFAVLNFPED